MIDWPTLLDLRKDWRREGKIVVWTNGCFDILHIGHLRSLRAACGFGDVLVVGINSDASVRKLKGPSRPIFPASERAELLGGLACVDHVVVFNETTPERAIQRLKPDVHCKGEDYRNKPMPEAAIVEAYGGRVEFLPMTPSCSTSAALAMLFDTK